ncbi:MAG: glycoside hydrolase family 2 TIM barrel-domain containing protein [Verrucomicrobiota bacterium]
MNPQERYPSRQIVSLDGLWDFARTDPKKDIDSLDLRSVQFEETINVPGCFDMLPSLIGWRGGVLYRRKIKVPPGARARLCFGGLSIWGKVFADGVKVGDQRKPYSTFCCDLPVSEREERSLVVYVDNRFDGERCPLVQPYHDYYLYGGIIRSVSLQLLPESFVENIRVFATDYESGRVKVTVSVAGKRPERNKIFYAFDDAQIESVDSEMTDGILSFEATVPRFKVWSPDSPNLHTLRLIFGPDESNVSFGIRRVETKENQIVLNGSSIKLLGVNRHEAHPTFGAAVPLQQQIADLQLLKDLGCNFIRGSHYPQDEDFLELCDRMGFLVWEESVGWGQTAEHFRNEDYCNLNLAQTREMIEGHWNHPCIIMWGFQNESESHLDSADSHYNDLLTLCRDLDDSRLVVSATNKGMQDRFLDQVDVVCLNLYPGWYSPADDFRPDRIDAIVPEIREMIQKIHAQGRNDRPFVISEIGAGAIYGFRDPICGMWTEEYQAEYLSQVCEEILENDDVAGVGLWQFCDCRTYNGCEALKRPRSFNNKGNLDEYRRPKLAYPAVKRIWNPDPS